MATIEGVGDVLARFGRFEHRVDDLAVVFDAVGQAVLSEARRRAPVVSGRLVSSLRVTGGRNYATVSAGGGGVRYAGVQEYGWARRRIGAQPYLRPAADASTDDAVRALTREINQQIKSAGIG